VLSVDEFSEWVEWFRLEAEVRKKALDKARNERRSRRR
jgi:hypothetical protein